MRTNPFAPDVPCHRVLAADGSLGGYKGVWEKEKESKEWKCKSRTRDEKIQLLVDEGVVFDDGGERARATGRVFGEFVDWGGK